MACEECKYDGSDTHEITIPSLKATVKVCPDITRCFNCNVGDLLQLSDYCSKVRDVVNNKGKQK